MVSPIVLIHYQEIALKGKNRPFFENKLISNIKKATGKNQVGKDFGRIIIVLKNKEEFVQLKKNISSITGIADFSLAYQEQKDINKIKKSLLQLIKEEDFRSFCLRTRRSDKSFPFTSQRINEKLGQAVCRVTKAKVDLENPDLKIYIEIGLKNTYLYFEKITGLGGLPVSSAGKLLSLISGGIDSPVASYKMIKRGSSVNFIHFHSYPQTSAASIEKVKEIVAHLNRFQFKATLWLVPFLSFQKECFSQVNHRFLVLLYRRAMFKIAQKLAIREGYPGLISGESLGQVASQTLPNLAVINHGLKIPIYRPLIGEDKQEIINSAKKIGTYEISIKPQQDCCSLFVPKHPITKAKLKEVLSEEAKIHFQEIIKNTLDQLETIKITSQDSDSGGNLYSPGR